MKRLSLTFAGIAFLCALASGLSSCVADVGGGVYYGPGHPWFHGGPWVYGHPWHGGGWGAHPPRP